MGIRKYKPTTPARRGSSVADFAEVTRSTPEKSLLRPLPQKGGRNNSGKITTRHQGGGHKRAYRLIDFRRADRTEVPAKVAHRVRPEPHQPHRPCCTTRTARSATSWHRKTCARVTASRPAKAQTSSRATTCRWLYIPTGTVVHAVEMRPGGGAKIARSAEPACSWSPRMAPTHSCGCRQGDPATSTCAAARRSRGRQLRQSNINWGKAAVTAGRASARRCWCSYRRSTTRTVVVVKTSGGRHPVNPKMEPKAIPARRRNRATSSSSAAVSPAKALEEIRCHAV